MAENTSSVSDTFNGTSWDNGTSNLPQCHPLALSHWLPHAFLWACTVPYFVYLNKRPTTPKNYVYNVVYRIRLVLSLIAPLKLICEVVTYTLHASFSIELIGPVVVKAISYSTVCMMMALEMRKGVHPCIIPGVFWFGLMSSHIGVLRAVIIQIDNTQPGWYSYGATCPITLTVVCLVFVFCLIVDFLLPTTIFLPKSSPLYRKIMKKKVNPYEWSSLLSRGTFIFMIPQLIRAYRRPLSMEDLFVHKPGDSAKELLQKYESWCIEDKNKRYNTDKREWSKWRIFWGILCLLMPPVIISFVIKKTGMLCRISTLSVLRSLLRFVEDGDPDTTWGVVLCCRLFAAHMIYSFCTFSWFYTTQYIGMQIQGLLSAALMKKYLSMSPVERRQKGGDITTHVTVDVQKVACMFSDGNIGFEVFIYVIPAVYYLYQTLGPSGFLGIGFALFVFVLNMFFLMKKVRAIKGKEMVVKSRRINIMQSILSGIKVLKFYAWEVPFGETAKKERTKELKLLRTAYIAQGVSVALSMTAPYVGTSLMLLVYVLSSNKNEVTVDRVFVAFSILDWFTVSVSFIPVAIFFVTQGYVSLKRLLAFLHDEDKEEHLQGQKELSRKSETSYKTTSLTNNVAVRIEDASFSWGQSEVSLHRINMNVTNRELIAVVGRIGSGKTTLLNALLGELNLLSGKLDVEKSVGYVPQEAWILHDSLRENVLFGQQYDLQRYEEVVQACALRPDFEALPDEDMTEIGERGVTLSGGQKQRVSLARAVYADAQLYLLDDPLSAVDAHVARHLFEQVIGPQGLLRDKTRILVTHSTQWLPFVNKVVVLDDGKIVECGSYDDLMRKGGYLAEHLEDFKVNTKDDDVYERESKGLATFKKNNEAVTKLMTEELLEHDAFTIHTLVTYIKSCGILWTSAFSLAFFIVVILQVSVSLWTSYWSSEWRENATLASENSFYRLGVYIGMGAGQGISLFAMLTLIAVLTMAGSKTLFSNLLDRLLRAKVAFFDTTPSGRILNWFTKDVDNIDNQMPRNLWFFSSSMLRIWSLLILIIVCLPIVLLTFIPIVIVSLILLVLYGTSIRQLMRLDGAARSPVFSYFNETKQGVVSIRSYGRVEHFCNTFFALLDKGMRPNWNFGLTKGFMFWATLVLASVFSFMISLICLHYRFSVNPSVAAAVIFYTTQIIFAIQIGVNMSCEIGRCLVSVERISSQNQIQEEDPWHTKDNLVSDDWPTKGRIEMDNYTASYRTSLDPVLREMTIDIKGNEKIGIVGRTGAGKTTLTAALFRMLEPASGSVKIDGVDLSLLGLHDLRARLTLITQEPVLFEGTLRANLDPLEQCGDAQVWAALEQAHLKNAVEALPEGLDTQCGSGGKIFSVGQRQLLCLTRALLRQSRILILDEPTAAVDVGTDQLVQQTLRTHLSNCTLLTIAHRVNTIKDYDRVMVMDNGQVVEFDSPELLLRDPTSKFYALALEAGLMGDQ